MPALNFPTLTRSAPHRIEWGLRSNVQVSTSPLNGSVQTVELPGARWRCTMYYENLLADDAAKLQSFLVQLRGQAGRFLCPCWARLTPRGLGGGAPLVSGAGQTGNVLTVSGASPSKAGWLREGDFISFGTVPELHMVKSDASTNVSGLATLSIEPPIRVSPANGAAVTILRPVAHMMLTESEVAWSQLPGPNGPMADVVIAAVETFA